MGKSRYLTALKSHARIRNEMIRVGCVNPENTITKDDFKLLQDAALSINKDVQIYAEDNTSDYDLSLIALSANQDVDTIDPKVLETARRDGVPILIKKSDNTFFVYGYHAGENPKWDYAPLESKEMDLNLLPFSERIIERKLLTPELKTILEKVHTPYYQQWLAENSLTENDKKDIHSLQQNELFEILKKAFSDCETEKAGDLRKSLANDRKKVLEMHPRWINTIDDHIIQTALYWALLHITNKPKDPSEATFIFYQGNPTKVAKVFLQFVKDNAEKYGFRMKNAKHYTFDLAELRDEFNNLKQQEKASMPANIQPSEIKEESVEVRPETQPVRVYPQPMYPAVNSHGVVLQAMQSYAYDLEVREGKVGVAEFFHIMLAMGNPPQQERTVNASLHQRLGVTKNSELTSSSTSANTPVAFSAGTTALQVNNLHNNVRRPSMSVSSELVTSPRPISPSRG